MSVNNYEKEMKKKHKNDFQFLSKEIEKTKGIKIDTSSTIKETSKSQPKKLKRKNELTIETKNPQLKLEENKTPTVNKIIEELRPTKKSSTPNTPNTLSVEIPKKFEFNY